MKALELTAPGNSTSDAETLRSQLRGGQIFGAFDDQEREHILTKLLLVDGLIPSLYTFFRDLQYLQSCVDCVKRLISPSPGQTLFNAMECAFTGINQRDDQVTLQIAESEFINRPGTVADQVNLGYQQIHAYAMRNFLDMPKEPHGENIRAIPNKEADKGTLRKFAELAQRLGFESPEISVLKEYPYSTTMTATDTPSKPVLVTTGRGEIKSQRCGLPRKRTYAEDSRFLYLNNLVSLGKGTPAVFCKLRQESKKHGKRRDLEHNTLDTVVQNLPRSNLLDCLEAHWETLKVERDFCDTLTPSIHVDSRR